MIDNINLANTTTNGAQSNYAKQSFTPNIAATGSADTVTANSPLPAEVLLQSATFLRSPDGGAGTAGQIFIDVYLGVGNGGTFVGSSSNSINLNSLGANTPVTWSFDNLLLSSASEYALVFSTDSGAGSPATARLTAAKNAAGSFVNTYNGGTADNDANGGSPVAFDTRFSVTVRSVPSGGSTALMMSAALVGLVGMKRKLR